MKSVVRGRVRVEKMMRGGSKVKCFKELYCHFIFMLFEVGKRVRDEA